MIDPMRENNLTNMNISNEVYNVAVEHVDDDQHEKTKIGTETRTKRKHDPVMGKIPQQKEFVQHELKMLNTLFSKYDNNQEFVDDCFNKSTYLKSYSKLMCPMKGNNEWPI